MAATRRVLVLTPGAYGINGGIAQHSRDLVSALALNAEVSQITVVPREGPSSSSNLHDKVQVLNEAIGGKIRFVNAAAKAAKSRSDVVICTHINLLPVGAILKGLLKARLVLVAHGIEVWTQRKRGARFWLRSCDAIWCVSSVTKDRMKGWAKLPDCRYTVIPNAVHFQPYKAACPDPSLRARLGLNGRKVLLTVSRLPGFDRYKGIDEVLESLPALARRDPTLCYLIVGDGEDRPRLEKKACSLAVDNRVIFAGYVSEEEKPAYYQLADVFVLPGRGEGFGIVFLEALASGLPVVGSVLDGSREALRDGLLGELVDPRDPTSVQSGILRALGKPKRVPEGLAYFSFPKFAERIAAGMRGLKIRPNNKRVS